jgi:signal transduction histidine kinase/ActR/RegA family two-component response regulator
MPSFLRSLFSLPGPYPARVTVEAVARLSLMIRSSAFSLALMPVPVVVVFWGEVPSPWLLGWWAVALSTPCGQYLLVRRHAARLARRGPPDLVWATRWARCVSYFSVVDGFVWGAACMMILVVDSLPLQMLVLVMTIGNAAGSIFATSYWPATQYSFSIPAIGLAALALILKGDPGSLGLATALLLYLLIVHFMVRQAYRTTMDGIQLQFENHDLVQRLRAQTEVAEQASAAKSKFLAAASHDLRQPLHALGLFVAALRERVTHAEAGPLLGNIDRSVAALGELLDALLDLSRLDAGVVEPQVLDVNLAPLLGQLAREYEPQARARALSFHCRGTEVVAQTDPVLLETILRNLISNALRYTEKGGVGIECRREGDRVRIEISDTGIGIAPEHHRDIFREFFQLQNPERDRAKGLGLGLAIVDRLNSILGYRLELHSSPGEGTAFTLSLPAGDPTRAQEAIEPAVQNMLAQHAPIKILVIDDEVAVRRAMRALLENWGYRVVVAASLEEALGALRRAPDAIIADYGLQKEQTGIAAVHAIRRRFRKDIPALIVTGDTAAERIAEIKESDLALLYKPVAPGKLRAFLRSAARGAVAGG